MKVVYQKMNKELAKKVLSKGATLTTAGKIIGNIKSLSQSKMKKEINLDSLSFSGRRGHSSKKIFYSEDEKLDGQLIYPVSEMSNFNDRLANELEYFHLFGYTIKNIEYVKGKRIAKITFVIQDSSADDGRNEIDTHEVSEFEIIFLDLDQVQYLPCLTTHELNNNSDGKNFFVLPIENDDDLENVAIADEQQKLLKLDNQKYSVVISTLIGNEEYYQTNSPSATLFKNHSFLKRNGMYYYGLFFADLDAETGMASEDYELIKDCYETQMSMNGFFIQDGRIVELDTAKNQGADLNDFNDYVLNLFGDDYVIANRYFDDRYSNVVLNKSNTNSSMIDSILDELAHNVDSKLACNTFIELEIASFEKYLDTIDDVETEENEQDAVSEEYKDIFDDKVQKKEDKQLPVGTDVDVHNEMIDSQIENGSNQEQEHKESVEQDTKDYVLN